MKYTDEEKKLICELRFSGASWKSIALAVDKKVNAIKKWHSKNGHTKENQKIQIKRKRKSITDGFLGLQIKQIVEKNSKFSLKEVENKLRELIPEGSKIPSKSTLHRFLVNNT